MKSGAPTGIIMNFLKSTLLSAWTPPLSIGAQQRDVCATEVSVKRRCKKQQGRNAENSVCAETTLFECRIIARQGRAILCVPTNEVADLSKILRTPRLQRLCRRSTASNSPVEAPEAKIARPKEPSSRTTSTSPTGMRTTCVNIKNLGS